MPVITLAITEQSPEKKKALIKNLTKATSDITGIPEQKFIVYIQEYKTESIGVGGQPLAEI